MKFILTMLILVSLASCFAISEYALMFLALEPSNITRGIGGYGVGVADIWHNDPLASYHNPALPALHDGLAYGYTHENWLKGSGINDLYYDTGMINFGYKGIGVILPAPNRGEHYGIDLDYGTQEYTDQYGNPVGTFSAYETATPYGLAVNPVELLRNYIVKEPLLQYIDLAIGAERLYIESSLGPGPGLENTNTKAKAQIDNLGLLASLNYTWEDYIKVEGVYGLTLFNLQKDRIIYLNAAQSDPIYRYRNDGQAVSVSLLPKKIINNLVKPEYVFCDNLLSFRYFYSSMDQYNGGVNQTGKGIEIGFLDTFFIRKGHFDDPAGHIVGDTEGIGINLHYKNLASYTYNTSTIPGGELVEHNKSTDQTFTINIVELYNLVMK